MEDKPVISLGVESIAHERARQIQAEGWTLERDLQHKDGSLLAAAMYYAAPDCLRIPLSPSGHAEVVLEPEDLWPASWDRRWAKRGNKERVVQLAVAGALIAAEIDRLLLAQFIEADAEAGKARELLSAAIAKAEGREE